MTDTKNNGTELSYADRKKALIAQGAERRKKIDTSIDIIRDNLHADVLAKSAVTHMTTAAYGAVEKLFHWNTVRGQALSANIKRFLPLAGTAYSIIKRRRMIKPVMGGGALAAVAAGGAYLYLRHKKNAEIAHADMMSYPTYGESGGSDY